MSDQQATSESERAIFHLWFGWTALLVSLSFGIALEVMHGLKLGLYLDVSNDTRRMLWTLAHTHGTLLGLVNIGFALTLRGFEAIRGDWIPLASRCLLGATVLLPGGFFLGGTVIYAGDPGLGVVLTPIGGALLFVSVLLIARAAYSLRS